MVSLITSSTEGSSFVLLVQVLVFIIVTKFHAIGWILRPSDEDFFCGRITGEACGPRLAFKSQSRESDEMLTVFGDSDIVRQRYC